MNILLKSALLASSLLAAAVPAHAANLLVNGSFEAGPALNFGTYGRGQAPTGWSNVSGFEMPDILSNGYVQVGAGFAQLLGAQDGSRYLDMNGASPTGAIFQDISGLTAGSTVTLSFWSSRWAQNSAGNLSALLADASNASVLNQLVLNYDYLPGATSSSWVLSTLSAIVPNSGSVRVRFDGNSGSYARGAPGLDNVSLTAESAVPEPATWAMMIAGFGLVGSAMRRRKIAMSFA